MHYAYKVAQDNIVKAETKNKTLYDNIAQAAVLEIGQGDRVLVRNFNLRGNNKIADRREPGMYKVLKRLHVTCQCTKVCQRMVMGQREHSITTTSSLVA